MIWQMPAWEASSLSCQFRTGCNSILSPTRCATSWIRSAAMPSWRPSPLMRSNGIQSGSTHMRMVPTCAM